MTLHPSPDMRPVPMPQLIDRCLSCDAVLIDGKHTDSGFDSCGWAGWSGDAPRKAAT